MYPRGGLIRRIGLLTRNVSSQRHTTMLIRNLSHQATLRVPIDNTKEYNSTTKFNRRGFNGAKVMSDPSLLQPRVILYDGVCHLCHNGVKWLLNVDRDQKLKFCCLQSKAAEPYLAVCGIDREDVLKRFVFIEGLGAYYQGSTAALKVAAYLPFPYSLVRCLVIIPAPLRDAVYDYVAKRRYRWFGVSDKCLIVEDVELLERFIDRDELIDR